MVLNKKAEYRTRKRLAFHKAPYGMPPLNYLPTNIPPYYKDQTIFQ